MNYGRVAVSEALQDVVGCGGYGTVQLLGRVPGNVSLVRGRLRAGLRDDPEAEAGVAAADHGAQGPRQGAERDGGQSPETAGGLGDGQTATAQSRGQVHQIRRCVHSVVCTGKSSHFVQTKAPISYRQKNPIQKRPFYKDKSTPVKSAHVIQTKAPILNSHKRPCQKRPF